MGQQDRIHAEGTQTTADWSQMSTEPRRCHRCSAETSQGIFCPSCNRVACCSEFVHVHWEKDEIDGLMRHLGDDFPRALDARLQSLEGGRLARQFSSRAVQLGVTPEEWVKTKNSLRGWAKTAGINRSVFGEALVSDKSEPRATEADLGMEPLPF